MRLLILLVVGFLSGCSSTPDTPEQYLAQKKLSLPDKNSIPYCYGYGCKSSITIDLSEREWKSLRATLRKTTSAESERAALRKAIGQFEIFAAAQAGTADDKAGTFRKLGDHQLDCVDESTNTTSVLMAFQAKGLLKFHDISGPTMRLPIIHAGRWPHQTAVIRDKHSAILYAVDSWFHDNGDDAEIVPLKEWKEGWKPKNTGDSWL